MSDLMQLDMLELIEITMEADINPVTLPIKPRVLHPGTCDLCGASCWDQYKYSDAEFAACYVAHHDGGRQCVRFTLRRGGTYEQN